jgi:5-methylcytosine-specific restriction endonuclease McrA
MEKEVIYEFGKCQNTGCKVCFGDARKVSNLDALDTEKKRFKALDRFNNEGAISDLSVQDLLAPSTAGSKDLNVVLSVGTGYRVIRPSSEIEKSDFWENGGTWEEWSRTRQLVEQAERASGMANTRLSPKITPVESTTYKDDTCNGNLPVSQAVPEKDGFSLHSSQAVPVSSPVSPKGGRPRKADALSSTDRSRRCRQKSVLPALPVGAEQMTKSRTGESKSDGVNKIEVANSQGNVCKYCQNTFGSWAQQEDNTPEKLMIQKEHFFPKGCEGHDKAENIFASCQICNRFKGSTKFQDVASCREWIHKTWKANRYEIIERAVVTWKDKDGNVRYREVAA